MNTKRVVLISTIAALYFVLTVAIAPLSYGPIQFRVSEALKVFVLFDPFAALGIGIGTFFANMMSPYAGPWDLIFMPITDMVGGLLAWFIYKVINRKLPIVPIVVYALTTGVSVGLMLAMLGVGGFWLMTASVGASELIILIAGIPVIFFVMRILRARGSTLFQVNESPRHE